jgi:hypothetical protein
MSSLFSRVRVLALLAVLLIPGMAKAFDVENHKGSYFYLMGGFMDASHDTNVRTGQGFGNDLVPGFGFTYGHNISNAIAPEIQFAYATANGSTPSGSSREHLLNVRLNAKYSFLTKAAFNQDAGWKLYPYAKAGGVAHAMYINAPNANDKVGAYGGGFGVGGGLEANYKALYLGLDISNDFLFLQAEKNTIAGVETEITNGGFDYQIAVMGAVGVHF